MGQIIDGKAVAKRVRKEVADRVVALGPSGLLPTLAVVLVGDDAASAVYVRNKERACKRAGVRSLRFDLPSSAATEDVLAIVQQLNDDPSVHGILVQMPLPRQCDSDLVLGSIAPAKDVDGLTPISQGRLASGQPGLVPCTPSGVMRLLREYDIHIEGAEAVIIGRSRLVGRPLAALLTAANATVTVCHSRTKNLEQHCRRADILIAAVGRPELVKSGWLKPGAAVIDVGINRLDDGSLVGDVAFGEALEVAAAVTPVPGGVGPMTIAMLLVNTVDAAEAAHSS
ncbi:MAG: methylenetetrahydrofolate dehydrogenase (NADP+)/methenyltetrahydrofolate cyclohydrolase [Myxococcota bacterium]|jgi:methylenetetrahydrofolate dehydrogenase (NADP+)/methenyltetrahydrofolate cyclohydrolase